MKRGINEVYNLSRSVGCDEAAVRKNLQSKFDKISKRKKIKLDDLVEQLCEMEIDRPEYNDESDITVQKINYILANKDRIIETYPSLKNKLDFQNIDAIIISKNILQYCFHISQCNTLLCPHLTDFDSTLFYNKASKIQWSQLTRVDLSDGFLTHLPEIFFNLLTKLKSLILSRNALHTLPNSINFLSQLQILMIDNNKYTKIPEVVYSLKSLNVLYMQKNQIEEINLKLSQLQQLEMVDIERNYIISLPPILFNKDIWYSHYKPDRVHRVTPQQTLANQLRKP